MKLESMRPEHLLDAIRIYQARAWPSGAPQVRRVDPGALEMAGSAAEMLALFDRERGQGEQCERWTLRLGNERYPFMKFVVQEYLVNDEFVFSVDTHDNLDVRPSAPDYAAWEELKVYNRRLREEIEADWSAAGLPTHRDLRRMLEGLATLEPSGTERARLLVADDDREVASGLAAWLSARGFAVELVHDGREAMARLGRDPRPDLVLLDYEMPGLDGEEVLELVHRDARLAGLPVLLATAAKIDLSRVGRASGVLQKPFPRQVLWAMLLKLLPEIARPGRVLPGCAGAGPGGEPPGPPERGAPREP